MIHRMKLHPKLFAAISFLFILTGNVIRYIGSNTADANNIPTDLMFGVLMGIAIGLFILSVWLDHGNANSDSAS